MFGRILKALWVLIVLTLFFFLLLPYFSPRYRGLLDNVVHPVLPAVSLKLYSDSTLEAENKELREKLLQFEARKDYWNQLFDENQHLRALQDLPKRSAYDSEVAAVSVRNPYTWKNRFVIDKGRNYELMVGMPVMVSDALFGRVVEVQKDHAVVGTLAMQNIWVSCRIYGTEYFGTLEGEVEDSPTNGIRCLLNYLPRDAQINAGMLVTTSGFVGDKEATDFGSGLIPGSLKVGTVVSVSKNEKFQTAIVELAAHWQHFDYVSVLKRVPQ